MNQYEQKHPLYAEYQSKRQKWSDIYEGGEQMQQRASVYLPRHTCETQAQYNVRIEMSSYRNFAAPIVDVFSASINEKRPPLVIPDDLESMRTDCDRTGTDADVFFGDITRMCAAEGVRFVLVDMPPTIGATRGEDLQAGRRMVPYFVEIEADSVLSWAYDDFGQLSRVTIAGTRLIDNGPFEEFDEIKEVTIWTRKEWVRYSTGSKNSNYVETGRGSHPLGVVPLVPFVFEPMKKKDGMGGVSVLDDVVGQILKVFRLDSMRIKSLFDSAVALLVGRGVDAESMKNFYKSSSNLICIPQDSAISFIEPSGTSYDAQEREANATIASIREIAMRQLRAPSLSVESADAKRLDRAQLDSQLVRFAKVSQSAEEQCWKLAARWLGLNVKDGDIAAPYNTDFVSDEEKAAKLERLINLQREGIISKQTVRESEEVKAIAPEGWQPEDEAARIAQDTTVNGGPNGVAALSNRLLGIGM